LVAHKWLIGHTPSHRDGREVTPRVFGTFQLACSLMAQGCHQQIAVAIVIVDTSEESDEIRVEPVAVFRGETFLQGLTHSDIMPAEEIGREVVVLLVLSVIVHLLIAISCQSLNRVSVKGLMILCGQFDELGHVVGRTGAGIAVASVADGGDVMLRFVVSACLADTVVGQQRVECQILDGSIGHVAADTYLLQVLLTVRFIDTSHRVVVVEDARILVPCTISVFDGLRGIVDHGLSPAVGVIAAAVCG